MRSPPPVPPLREDIAAKKIGGRIVAEDARRRVRVPVDELTLAVMQALADGPADPDELAEAIEAPRVELWRRVELLNRHNLLETPRAAEQLQVHELSAALVETDPAESGETPLGFHPGLAHGCVACGGCCHGTDVGPLKDDDVARIRAIDWRPHLPAEVTPDAWIDDVPAERSPTGRAIRLMGMRHGRCVFLGDDKLCVIHKHAGAQQKPTICRQFPYTFTKTPGGRIDVSFSTECRAWWKARNNAAPPAGDASQLAAIRTLIAEGAPILSLAAPIAVVDGVDLDLASWEALRAEILRGLERAERTSELVMAVVGPLIAALDGLVARHRESELFATRAAFRVPEPDPIDQTSRFLQTLERLRQTLVGGIDELARRMREAGQRDEADRATRIAWGLDELLVGRDLSDLVPFAHAVAIWRDLAVASVQSHEPARRGDLALGLATLSLKLMLGPTLAGLSAQTALRGRVHEQEVVDAMVLVTKLLRGSAFERLLAGARRDLVAVFVCDAATLALGEAPRPLPSWLG